MPCSLRLVALDSEDLAVISANLQDSLVRIGDMTYLPRSKRFALVASRFDWVSAAEGKNERCRTGLHFERVLKATCTGFDQKSKDLCLSLLSIAFMLKDAPAGHVILTFSGGAAVRLEVECLEAQVADLGPRWPARTCPEHKFEDAAESQAS
ncbi:MAG TPA: DUF2948 family protein [Methylovirgula sp.]|nr:DUF2948 family protein [Methylovirgula sp.]